MATPKAVTGLAAALSLLCGLADAEPAIWTKRHDPEMERAIADAQKSLPLFWRKVDSHRPDIGEHMVKIGYPTPQGGIEFLWMDVKTHNATTVRGVLVNEPEAVPGVHEGQLVGVSLSRIADWSYAKGGRYFGQFTTRVVLKHADATTRLEEGARLWPTALEPGDH